MTRIIFGLFAVFSVLTLSGGLSLAEDKKAHEVVVSISKCRLWLYEVSGEEKRLVKEYLVSTVKTSIREYALGIGIVTGIELDPVWIPTKLTRNEFRKKGVELPDIVPPGHPLNYMGSVKIFLSHSVPGKGKIYRIHGVRKEDERLLGKRVSGGCIRMKNEEVLELASLLKVGDSVEIIK